MMGGKYSRMEIISYENACSRVSNDELKRLRAAFKCFSSLSGFMGECEFFVHVLQDRVPCKVSQVIFRAFGGSSKGITFKDLLCCLVVLTMGTMDEKVKLVFGIYAEGSFPFIQKDEMDRRVLQMDHHIVPALSDLFKKVAYGEFRCWVLKHPDCTIVCQWLLDDVSPLSLTYSIDIPTFYQTLAGITHLEEKEIIALEKRYSAIKSTSNTMQMDINLFCQLVSPPLPDSLSCADLFLAFDENNDNQIDFKELVCGISACCRGPYSERHKFCFRVFDRNHDGTLGRKDLVAMVHTLLGVSYLYSATASSASPAYQCLQSVSSTTVVSEILSRCDIDKTGSISQEDYLMWAIDNSLTGDFVDLLSQVCCVVFGLRPQNPLGEGDTICKWLDRESRQSLREGQVYYLVSMHWWNIWLDYVYGTKAFASLKPKQGNRSKSFEAADVESPLLCNDTVNAIWNVSADLVPNGSLDKTSNHLNGDLHGDVSSTSSVSVKLPQDNELHPPPIDNTVMLAPPTNKLTSLTDEGGELRQNPRLVSGKDFEIVPQPIWRALFSWYGGSPSLPRTAIVKSGGEVAPSLELYPLTVHLYRHCLSPSSQLLSPGMTVDSILAGGLGTAALRMFGASSSPHRYLAHCASFSCKQTLQRIYDVVCTELHFKREDVHLWKISTEGEQHLTFLDDDATVLENLGFEDCQPILIETRNKDLTWPEEMYQLARNRSVEKENAVTVNGTSGLNNLGNTCFMNAALQCVSNTQPLTRYFVGGLHYFEVNRNNPLGMKGHIAQRYGQLVKDLWNGRSRSVAPLKLRLTIGKYASRFSGFQQHDSQELLSFLLDGLHEDLNRVRSKPYTELKDSDGRPDAVVAMEAWENHLMRNQSIIVDLFHGQLKSQLCCKQCGKVSVRFDPYSYLALPIPMESCIYVEVIVKRIDGLTPVKYGLCLDTNLKYRELKRELSSLSGIPTHQLVMVMIIGPVVEMLPSDYLRVKPLSHSCLLYAYELPSTIACNPSMPRDQTTQCRCEENGDDDSGKPGEQTNGHVIHSTNERLLPDVSPVHPIGTTPTCTEDSLPATSSLSPCQHNACSHDVSPSRNPELFDDFLIAFHRKMEFTDLYFLSNQKARPVLFGTPIVVPRAESTSNHQLYISVWVQVSRFLSPLLTTTTTGQRRPVATANHALDCDDSLGHEYPFSLKVVQKDGLTCASCPWYRFCNGCPVKYNMELFTIGHCHDYFLAVDWEPTAYHVRYQSSLEMHCLEHESVAMSRRQLTEPVDLDTCLRAFTQEEELGEDEKWHCSGCKEQVLATKKLDIWRLPPILIINLKRFQCLNGWWVKSHKIVHFPCSGFDPSRYLADTRIKQPMEEHYLEADDALNTKSASSRSEAGCPMHSVGDDRGHHVKCCEECTTNHCDDLQSSRKSVLLDYAGSSRSAASVVERSREDAGVCGDHNSEDGQAMDYQSVLDGVSASPSCQNSRLENGPTYVENCSAELGGEVGHSGDDSSAEQTLYDLYAMSCHTGILGRGHYVAYARNPNGKWYCYNDSTCKEVPEESLDINSAYILFYERRNIDLCTFLPDLTNTVLDISEIEDDIESKYKRFCVVQ